MKNLIQGVLRFHESVKQGELSTYLPLAQGQSPHVFFIGCADSRVVPGFLLDAAPGEVFTIRNVGNQVPRVNSQGESLGDRSEASAIEYAVNVLAVEDIVVCGHSGCGAMAALSQTLDGSVSPNLPHWVNEARGVLDESRFCSSLGSGLSPTDQLSQRNVAVQLERLEGYPCVARGLETGRLRIHGWWFNIGKGRIEALRPDRSGFGAFEEVYA